MCDCAYTCTCFAFITWKMKMTHHFTLQPLGKCVDAHYCTCSDASVLLLFNYLLSIPRQSIRNILQQIIKNICRGQRLVFSAFPDRQAQNIGAYVNSTLEMKTQINNLIWSCYHQLQGIAKIRKYLSLTSVVNLCHAFLTSKLNNLKFPTFQNPQLPVRQNAIRTK